MRSTVFAVTAALARIEPENECRRITGSVAEGRAAGKDLGGRRPTFVDDRVHSAVRLIESGEPASQVARVRGMSKATVYRPPSRAAVQEAILVLPEVCGSTMVTTRPGAAAAGPARRVRSGPRATLDRAQRRHR